MGRRPLRGGVQRRYRDGVARPWPRREDLLRLTWPSRRREYAVSGRIDEQMGDGLGRDGFGAATSHRSRCAGVALSHPLASAAERIRQQPCDRGPFAESHRRAHRRSRISRLSARAEIADDRTGTDTYRRRTTGKQWCRARRRATRPDMALFRRRLSDPSASHRRGFAQIVQRFHAQRRSPAAWHDGVDICRSRSGASRRFL